jgi:hypothetical protein
MVSIKARMAATALSATELIDSMNTVEAALRQRFPQVRWSFLEPDTTD